MPATCHKWQPVLLYLWTGFIHKKCYPRVRRTLSQHRASSPAVRNQQTKTRLAVLAVVLVDKIWLQLSTPCQHRAVPWQKQRVHGLTWSKMPKMSGLSKTVHERRSKRCMREYIDRWCYTVACIRGTLRQLLEWVFSKKLLSCITCHAKIWQYNSSLKKVNKPLSKLGSNDVHHTSFIHSNFQVQQVISPYWNSQTICTWIVVQVREKRWMTNSVKSFVHAT